MEEAQKVIFKPLHKKAKCPKRHSDGAAGYDLYAICDGTVPPNSTLSLSLGFSLQVPKNMIGYICGRSGPSVKNGVNVENACVSDDTEVHLNLCNYSNNPFTFESGDRIGQLFFAKIDENIAFSSIQ